MSSDTGLMMGADLEFDYALVPHEGDWRKAEYTATGMNIIIRCCAARQVFIQVSCLRHGHVEVSGPNVVITALKPGKMVRR